MDDQNYQQIYQRIIEIKSKQNQTPQPPIHLEPERTTPAYQYPNPNSIPISNPSEEFKREYRSYSNPYSIHPKHNYPHHYPQQHAQRSGNHFPTTRERLDSIGINSLNSMYPLGMQHSASPYPFSYPYYSYPGFSYPYGSIYPPLYYNRSPNEPYSSPSDRSVQGYPSYFPPQTHYSNPRSLLSQAPNLATQQARAQMVKQQIVISSDEEKVPKRETNVADKRNKLSKSQLTQQIIKKPIFGGVMSSGPQIGNLKVSSPNKSIPHRQQDDNPFYIKHKRIRKDDKSKSSKHQHKRNQHDQKSDDRDSKNINKLKDKDSKQKSVDQAAKNPVEAPQLLQNEENKSGIQAPLLSEKDTGKKERVREEHPLRQLRYSESHGRIRIGNYYQSTIPDLLDSRSIAVLRKKMQIKLQQREVAALTF